MIDVPGPRFDALVQAAIKALPGDLAAMMDNVVIVVEDDPPADDPYLLGLYHGVPLTSRGNWYSGVLPDRISVYRNPILMMCTTEADVVREVHITVVHEIAHHFGIGDKRLHELGYG